MTGAPAPRRRRNRVPDLGKRCAACLFLPAQCLCGEIAPVETRTRILILRHASELRRTTNTVRWAALALRGVEVVDYGRRGLPPDLDALDDGATRVLFPAPEPTPVPSPPPRRLVVLDGSWSQARRMVQRVPALRTLPRLSLPGPEGGERLRTPTVKEGMSTIEAIARALALLGEPEAARALDAVHALALRRADEMRGFPLARLRGPEGRG